MMTMQLMLIALSRSDSDGSVVEVCQLDGGNRSTPVNDCDNQGKPRPSAGINTSSSEEEWPYFEHFETL